jgi:hypothetical protein
LEQHLELKYTGKVNDEKEYLYIVSKLWNKLNYLSNIEFYKNIDWYIDANKGFISLILTIIENKSEKFQDRIENFRNSFKHINLKTIYPSIKYYKDFDIDFTLLFLENITSDEDIYDFVNTTMKEEIPLNERLDNIITTSPDVPNKASGAIGNKYLKTP